MVIAIIFKLNLDVQQGLSKLTMKFNVIQAMAKVSALITDKLTP
jgi:hypothetical protein